MRVLILSDIHANLVALETVLNATKGDYDTVWCLGDIVGYGPHPNECVALVQEHASLSVMGNHDSAVLDRISVEEFNPQAQQAIIWTRNNLNSEHAAYLDTMPDTPLTPPGTENLIVTHASPREPVLEYVSSSAIAFENFHFFNEHICLVGHTHRPAIYRWQLEPNDAGPAATPTPNQFPQAVVDFIPPPTDGLIQLETSDAQRLIINPGSIGQPRDNDARAAYAIFDTDALIWDYNRIAYPVELTQSEMRRAGLPKRLIDRLSFGW
ncbi:MAG: metallophosphoesterase family protein [Chloroflexota bacterium]